MEKKKKKLGVPELAGYGIGNCIGSGIFVTMGAGIAYTGRSISLALVCACVVVLFAYAYNTLMSGMFVLPGGKYSQAALLQPPLLVGVSAISTIFTGIAFAMYALSVVEYAKNVFPVIEQYRQIFAVAIITLFFLTTLLGGKFMGKFNLIMVAVLIISLLVYIAVGVGKVDWQAASPASQGYFKDGAVGFIMAVAMMSFACQGATMPIAMTADAKEPKKSLPKAIIAASVIVAAVYALIGIVSSCVLPVDEIENMNLGDVAKVLFGDGAVYVIFNIGGACFAIATSLYGAIAGIQHPLLVTIEDGWLPKFLGKKTKSGYPWVMMLVLYIVAIIPIFYDLGLDEIVSLMMIPVMVLNLVNNILMFPLIKKYPNAWKDGFFRMPKGCLIATIVLAILCDLLISAALLTTIDFSKAALMLVLIAALFGYSFYRLKAGKVNLSAIEQAKSEAQGLASLSSGDKE